MDQTNQTAKAIAVILLVILLGAAYWYFYVYTKKSTTSSTTPTTTSTATTTPTTTSTATTPTTTPAVNQFAATGSNNGVWMKTYSGYYSDSSNVNSGGLGSQSQAQQLSGAWAVSYSDPNMGGNGQWYAQSKAPTKMTSGNGSYYSQYAAPAGSNLVVGYCIPAPQYGVISATGMTLTSNQVGQVYTLSSASLNSNPFVLQIAKLGSGPFVWNQSNNQVVFFDKV